jgi:hypothetical protein
VNSAFAGKLFEEEQHTSASDSLPQAMADNDSMKKFEKGSDRDNTDGPLKKRRCTDSICEFIILGH